MIFSKIFVGIKNLLEVVVGAIFFSITFLTIIQVFMRYIFNNPLMWGDEMVRLLLIWGTLLGCGLAIYYSKHINLDFIIEKFPEKIKGFIYLIGWTLIICLSVFYVYKGFLIAIHSKGTLLTALNLSKMYYYGSVPISALFWIFFSIQKVVEIIDVTRKVN